MPCGPGDQKGVRHAAGAISGKQGGFRGRLAEQHGRRARMRRFVDAVVLVGCARAHDAPTSLRRRSPLTGKVIGSSLAPTAFQIFRATASLGPLGIDDDAALRLLGRDRKIGLAQFLMKLHVFRLEAVGLGFAAAQFDPLQPELDRHVEDQSEVGRKIADRNAFEPFDQPLIDLAEDALIDARGIGEAVADHPFAGIERRQDGALHVVVARRRKQHRLDLRSERLCRARQQHVADDLGARRAARLARQMHGKPKRFQAQRQHRGLGRLAGALAALERDELASHCFKPVRRRNNGRVNLKT